MMPKELLLCLLLLPSVHARAQAPYDDLLVLYVDEDYEKCLHKADRYVERDATHKDPLPYLYESMCYYEMSKIPKYQEMDEYRHAGRDALKWAVKYRRKDKDLIYFADHEDYWSDLNAMAQEEGLNELDDQAYGKARLQFTLMTRYDPANPGPWALLALAQAKLHLMREAAASMERFDKAFAAVTDVDHLPPDQRTLLREGLMRNARFQEGTGQLDRARTTIDLGKAHFMKNAEFRSLYDELSGSIRK